MTQVPQAKAGPDYTKLEGELELQAGDMCLYDKLYTCTTLPSQSIIAATNAHLSDATAAGQMEASLYDLLACLHWRAWAPTAFLAKLLPDLITDGALTDCGCTL